MAFVGGVTKTLSLGVILLYIKKSWLAILTMLHPFSWCMIAQTYWAGSCLAQASLRK